MANKAPPNARRQVGVLAVIGMAARMTSQAMTLILLLLAGHFLTVELFGVFVLASILMNFSVMQMYSGIYHYVLKEPGFESRRETAFGLQILFSLGFALLILATSGLVHVFGWGDLLAVLIAATALMPVLAMLASWQEAVLLRRGEVKIYYAAAFGSEVSGFLLGVFLLLQGAGVWALIVNRYCAFILMGAALSLRVRTLPRPRLLPSDARPIIQYSLGLYGNAGLAFFSSYGAALIMGGFLSATAVGLYRMGARTATAAFDIFAQTFRILTWQAVGRMAREDRLPATLWTRLLAIDLSIMIFILGSLSLLAEDLTMLLLGPQWAGMVPVLQIICWVKVIASVDLVATAQLAAAGRTRFLFRARLLEGTILLAVLLVTVPFGMVAVTFGLFPPTIVYAVLLLRQLLDLTATKLRSAVAEIAPGILLATGSLAVVFLTASALDDQPAIITICTTAVVGLASYVLLAFVFLRDWTLATLHSVSTAILPSYEDPPAQKPATS